MHILPRHALGRFRTAICTWLALVQRGLFDATRDAIASLSCLTRWPWRVRRKVAPPPLPALPHPSLILRPKLRRSASLPVLPDVTALEQAQTLLRRRHSMLPSAQPAMVRCGPALELFLSHDLTVRPLNRARYLRYVGTLAREGGPPCGALEAQAAAQALHITLRVWNGAPSHGGSQPAVVFTCDTEPATVVELVTAAPPSCTALQFFDAGTGRVHDVGDDGESLYACLAYALDLDHIRSHRAAYGALCHERGAAYMSFVNEFLPPRTTCLADLRARVADVMRQDARYVPHIDAAVAQAIGAADRAGPGAAAPPSGASLATRDGDSADSTLSSG